MPDFPSHRVATILLSCLAANAAQADVTAQQVWDNWTEQTEIYGEGFTTGSETYENGVLTVTDVKIEMSDDEATILAEIGTIVLVETGDGTVNVMMQDSYPMTIIAEPGTEDAATINLLVEQSGLMLTASGDKTAINYDVASDSYAIRLDSLEGAAKDEVEVETAIVTLRDLEGRYGVTSGNLNVIDYDLSLGSVDFDFLANEISGDGTVAGNVDIADLVMTAKASLPVGLDLSSEEFAFQEGTAFEGGYTFGNVAYAFDVKAEGEDVAGQASAEGGTLSVAFDADGVAYTGQSRGIALTAVAPNELPFPIEASLGQYGFDMRIPLSQGDAGPQLARVAFDITDLSLSDAIWDLFDQAAVLPRSPVTVALGVDAQVTPFFDFLDPDQQEAIAMAVTPGELNSAEITALTIRGAGAEITGAGAFTFYNDDLQTFDGFPRPEGQVDFTINGINGLVDNLIEMGLIPAEEAMMPRMMLGMFTQPVGDDMLTSTIEVNTEGHVLANGQRLR